MRLVGRILEYAKLHARSHARSHDHRSCDHGVAIAFFFSVSSHKQIIVKKAIYN